MQMLGGLVPRLLGDGWLDVDDMPAAWSAQPEVSTAAHGCGERWRGMARGMQGYDHDA